jgi:hypothetical protein
VCDLSEKIFTIPINEAFDVTDGCPLCRMRAKLEDTTLTYVLGAAMMEPDVRIKMNEAGFCAAHADALRARKNKLPLALILQSHLDEVKKLYEAAPAEKKGLFASRQPTADGTEAVKAMAGSCFVCKRVRSTELHYFSNIAYLWDKDPAFHQKMKKQPFLCVSHTAGVLEAGKRELKSEKYQDLYETVTALNRDYLDSLRRDLDEFTVSFDHRNAGAPLSDAARTAIERAQEFLK